MKHQIDMNRIRHLNLFEKITRTRAMNCFFYNGAIYFAVEHRDISKSIGKESSNLKKISSIISRKVRVISLPRNNEETKRFITNIIQPIMVQDIQVNNNEVIIDAGNRQTRALLIGREKKKLEELKNVTTTFLNKELKLI
jgi:NusA-like KH domain protein